MRTELILPVSDQRWTSRQLCFSLWPIDDNGNINLTRHPMKSIWAHWKRSALDIYNFNFRIHWNLMWNCNWISSLWQRIHFEWRSTKSIQSESVMKSNTRSSANLNWSSESLQTDKARNNIVITSYLNSVYSWLNLMVTRSRVALVKPLDSCSMPDHSDWISSPTISLWWASTQRTCSTSNIIVGSQGRTRVSLRGCACKVSIRLELKEKVWTTR